MNAYLARLLLAARNRLPLGQCVCHEPTVKWCGRHGLPLRTPAYRHWSQRAQDSEPCVIWPKKTPATR